MENNLKEFIALRDKYKSITFKSIHEVCYGYKLSPYRVMHLLTGFGECSTCTLCIKAIQLRDNIKGYGNFCDFCSWDIDKRSILHAPCANNTYDNIRNATTYLELLMLLKVRINEMTNQIEYITKLTQVKHDK